MLLKALAGFGAVNGAGEVVYVLGGGTNAVYELG